jgi:hypothetical protein
VPRSVGCMCGRSRCCGEWGEGRQEGTGTRAFPSKAVSGRGRATGGMLGRAVPCCRDRGRIVWLRWAGWMRLALIAQGTAFRAPCASLTGRVSRPDAGWHGRAGRRLQEDSGGVGIGAHCGRERGAFSAQSRRFQGAPARFVARGVGDDERRRGGGAGRGGCPRRVNGMGGGGRRGGPGVGRRSSWWAHPEGRGRQAAFRGHDARGFCAAGRRQARQEAHLSGHRGDGHVAGGWKQG